MALFALADLHLGQAVDKPMDVFGAAWQDHTEQIRRSWCAEVSQEDTVLVPGDISWAMHLPEAIPDLDWIAALPGKKILLRGNHDYWWSSIKKVRQALAPGVQALQNDAFIADGYAICGSRGWLLPTHPKFTEADQAIYLREAERLQLSLKAAAALALPMVAMMHYPPTDQDGSSTLFTDLLEQYGVERCVYGHLHGPAHRFAFEGTRRGVSYHLVSADYLRFAPLRL
ncbi:metallophosphoesterase [Alicyclobacillus cycloheptanicus]|uniref:Phosphohydrolase n=1 Tax=Alicyclobacillus cycloheptanicus TaxID=1457 RepID=A0ABT9XDU0_9BACL|nr:metallophosphoesterase [Alicyclobacillus cycloheptanicus]MDQ0188466.1 putative phosphohydrolase [Alicyclobacillus cycloheptanicus]WDM01158.1 metallophosphoesterase [Alicyclobacillus cycloheptanicus]